MERIKNIKAFFRDLKRFFKNLWIFKEALWNYRWWDYTHSLFFLEVSFLNMAKNFSKYGNEIDSSRRKKEYKMKRAAYLIKLQRQDLFIELAEKELGEVHTDQLLRPKDPEKKAHNNKVFDLARELEEKYWEELFITLRGTQKETQHFSNVVEADEWIEHRDGTDMRSWWD